ncbi:MAG TPA: hypothetical protein VF516_26215 [Kofleriaceae bacterium]
MCWKLDLLALAGALPLDRLSLAVSTEAIAPALAAAGQHDVLTCR